MRPGTRLAAALVTLAIGALAPTVVGARNADPALAARVEPAVPRTPVRTAPRLGIASLEPELLLDGPALEHVSPVEQP